MHQRIIAIIGSAIIHAGIICGIFFTISTSQFSGGTGGSHGSVASVWINTKLRASDSAVIVKNDFKKKSAIKRRVNVNKTAIALPQKKLTTKSPSAIQYASKGKGRGTMSTKGQGIGQGKGSNAGSHQNAETVLSLIRKQIESNKHYPHIAQVRGYEGSPVIRFQLDAQGRVKRIFLVQSSGYRILDKDAIQTVKRSAPFPVYTDAIQMSLNYFFTN